MNNMSLRHNLARKSQMSEMADEQKLIEGQMQLEDETESRARRIRMHRQRQAKLRVRALKLAGFGSVVMFGEFFALAWFSNDVMALIAR